MMSKIQKQHKEKTAYVYLRQSTMGQVRHHQESTERQYALKNKALSIGWSPEKILILDGDLGMSGTQMSQREDFKSLVADVSMNKVGAVFALEASRLSRSNTDWHRLLELCALTGTLIIDEDGCYDPSDFNDQLLLGLKGTMSQAELHFIRARLQGGKLNKAKKGKLRFPLPVGLCHDDEGYIVLDPDMEVGGIINLLFSLFKETGSAYGVVRRFGEQNIKFPKRSYGGIWAGKLIWGRLTYNRILGILKNPSYAGAYVYGRYKYQKIISPDGHINSRMKKMPISDWQVNIKGHHDGYITWKEFLQNQEILTRNRTNGEEMLLNGPAREGLALLQGLLLCGICGRRLTVRYKGNGGIYPTYECNWRKREGMTGNSCMSLRADLIDNAVSQNALAKLKPEHIKVALRALEELERRNKAVDKQWCMRIERVEYETQLAQRRYEEVDPSNRIVAATLESRWNDALLKLEEIKKEYGKYKQKEVLAATSEQKKKILSLTQDMPRLWNAPTTKAKDRKRILRLLIKDITVEKFSEPKKAILHIRWQGGTCEDIVLDLPQNIYDRLRYPKEIIDEIRELAVTLLDSKIAEKLNQEGQLSPRGKKFTTKMIQWTRYKYSIPQAKLKLPHELTVKQVADKFGVSSYVVYYWIERGHINVRRINKKAPYWISVYPKKERELLKWVRNSSRITKKTDNIPKST